MRNFVLSLAALAAHGLKQDVADEPIMFDYICDETGHKICTERMFCPDGFIVDEKACTCTTPMKCRMMCPLGQQLDPRYPCKCVDQSVIDSLTQCEASPQAAP